MTTIINQAYFENENFSIWIELEHGPDGEIFVTDVSIQPKQKTAFEQRHGKSRHGLELDETEAHAESLLPVTRAEQMMLFR